jgi:hypothetical protein
VRLDLLVVAQIINHGAKAEIRNDMVGKEE